MCEQECDSQLRQIMRKSAGNAGKEKETAGEKAADQSHTQKTEKAACQTVEKAHGLTCKQRREKNTSQKHQTGFLEGIVLQQDQGNDIGESQFDAGNRHRGRKETFC